MINDNVELNLKNLNFKENKIKENIFLSKKHSKTGDLFLEDFEDGLNISGIENKEENQKYIKRAKDNNNINNDEDFNEDLDNFNDSESIIRKLSFDSIHIDFNYKDICNNKQKMFKKKKTKEDLNNTPLPIFDCIYCTNEKIVFSNFINRIISDKYLFLTSIYDIKDLNKLIIYQPLIDKNEKNDKLLNIIIKNTEYISQYIQKENNITYFKSNSFKNLCEQYKFDNHRLIKQKIEDSLVRKKKDFYFKGINKISKNSVNNKCLFNSTNSLINNFNALSGLVEPIPQNLISIKNNCTIVSGSNNSINFNSLSLNNNEFVCFNNKENNNMLDYIVEKIEKKDESANYGEDKDEIMDFFKFDLVRKISKNDIKWENKYYDIYNPEISFDNEDESDQNNQDNYSNIIKNKNLKLNINKNTIKSDKNLFNIYNVENKHKKLETQNFTLKINHILKDKSYNFNKVNKRFSGKSLNYNSIQKDSKKLKNNKFILKDINLKKSIDLNNFLNQSTSKSLLNNKLGLSYLRSFYSSSTIDNSSNINKNSLVGLKNTCKYYENKLKNKKIIISYGSKKSINNNSSSNYSIGVNISIRLNTSMKSNNCIKYNCSNTGMYSKNKSTLIYDYKLKNKIPNKNNNYINTSLNFKNKSNITYKYHLKNKKSNLNILKNNKLYKLFNISKLINLNNTKSNYEKKNINKEGENINICKSQNKRSNKDSYINYNLLKLKEKKNNNSITNNTKTKNNLLKSGIILSSSSLITNTNNNKLPHKKSFIFNFINNKNNSYSNINTTKITLKNNNSSSLYNKLYDNQLNRKYYINNKSIKKKDLFLNKKKNNTFYQYQTLK